MENTQNLALGASDRLIPFQIESSLLRGRIVRLDASINTILHQHDYPEAVAVLLAEAAAMAAVLATALKFDGIFTVQAKSEGPVTLLVADVTSDGAVRAYAQYDAAALASHKGALLGAGQLVFTVDQIASDERYQGIVALEGDNLTAAFQTYFRQSEQIPTGLLAAAARDAAGHWHAGCLMLQRMPAEGGIEAPTDSASPDDWQTAMALMQTCTPEELTNPALDLEDLLFRLFHEEGVRIFDARRLRHECRCSRERIATLLQGMPKEDVEHIVVDDVARVTCQFCSKTYEFTGQDIAVLRDNK